MTRMQVVVVDDEAELRELYATFLDLDGFDVAVAATAVDARTLLSAASADAVVVDRFLDGNSGRAFARELRAAHPGLRIVLMSGLPTDPIDGIHVLRKPFPLASLGGVLRGKGVSVSCRCSHHDDFVPSAG